MNRDRSCPSDSIDIAAPQDAGGRLQTLDLLRGLTLISMIIYHGMWDFLYLSESGASMTALRTWYEGGGHLWQQSICRTFILLSGFCVPFSRHIFRRGLQISAGGAAVSAVTVIALYEDRVLFGVLTFLGAAMLVTGGLYFDRPGIYHEGIFLHRLLLFPSLDLSVLGWIFPEPGAFRSGTRKSLCRSGLSPAGSGPQSDRTAFTAGLSDPSAHPVPSDHHALLLTAGYRLHLHQPRDKRYFHSFSCVKTRVWRRRRGKMLLFRKGKKE